MTQDKTTQDQDKIQDKIQDHKIQIEAAPDLQDKTNPLLNRIYSPSFLYLDFFV